MKKLPILIIALLFLASCQDDEKNPLTSDEAIEALQDTGDKAVEDIIDLMSSEGMSSIFMSADYIAYFMDYGSSVRNEGDTKDKILQLFRLFAKAPATRVSTDTAPTGVYSWDASLQEFVFIEDADVLILKFPVGDSGTNNGVFTVNALQLSATEMPELVDVELTVGDEVMASLYLAVNWSQNDYPEEAEINLFLKPFTLTVGFNLSDGLQTTFDALLKKGNDEIASVSLVSSSLVSAIFNEELPQISGHIAYRNIRLQGSVDLEGVDTAIANETDPNESIDLQLLIKGEVVGDIILVLETNEGYTDYYPYVEFQDGTQVSVDDLLSDAFDSIEEQLGDISL